MKKPAISIIVPTYNDEPYLRQALDSAVNQTLRDIEIICVNDGSTDGTAAILREYAEKDSRVRVIDKERNGGTFMARESGVGAARGEYILFLDADDYLSPKACKTTYRLITKCNVDILQFTAAAVNCTAEDFSLAEMDSLLLPQPGRLNREEALALHFVERVSSATMCGKLYRADVLKEVQKQTENYYSCVGEDCFHLFCTMCMSDSFQGVRTPVLYHYCYGRGITDVGYMPLEKFERYCQMSTLCGRCRDFLERTGLFDELRCYYEGFANKLLGDCCALYCGRIAPDDMSEAAEQLLSAWKEEIRERGSIFRLLFKQIETRNRLLYKPIDRGAQGAEEENAETGEKQTQHKIVPENRFDFTKEPGRRLLNRPLRRDGAPQVSIVTPYYNAGKFFEQTYNSVMNQTFPWFEWLIVDDGSTDKESVEILSRFASKDERIRTFRKDNGGISTARNLAIRNARTEIIILLDADDLIEPTYVEILYWALRLNPDCAWAYSNSIGFQNQQYTWDKPFDAETLKTYNFLTYSAAICKADIEEVGCYDEVTKHYYEDWRLWLKLLSAQKKPVKTGNFGFWYRRLDSGVLSIVNKDPETQRLAARLIEEVAATADTSVTAKTFSLPIHMDFADKPQLSDWDRKLFAKHKKTHVLLLLPWMVMGGADLFNLDVCAGLDKSRYELGIITTQPGEQVWQQRFAEHVTDIFNLPEFLDQENWAEFISYYIKSREVDVLFLSNSYYGYYLLPWLRKEFPELVILDYIHMEEWYYRAGGYARYSGTRGDVLEKTLVCNERTRRVMLESFGRAPESVETLYIGVDAEKFDPAAVEPGQARTALDIKPERPIVLFPCRLHPQKRPFLMLEIAKRLPELAFVVVGDGPNLDELKKAVKQKRLENTVFFAGAQSDMLPWYRDASLTLICSLKEGLALTAYESLSMGVPVVSADVGGQRELIDDSVGRLVPLMQDEAKDMDRRDFSAEEIGLYVTAIKELLADKEAYAAMRENCRRRIEAGFSTRLMVKRLEAVLTDLTVDQRAREARLETARALQKLPRYVDESFSACLRFDAKEREADEVWRNREQYRQLAESGSGTPAIPADVSEAQRTLDWIYHMRSWRLVQAYCRFMDETRLGHILCRIRDFFRK